jgi:hypothetical protein
MEYNCAARTETHRSRGVWPNFLSELDLEPDDKTF